MTELSRFYGIKVAIHMEVNAQHNIPHVHAKYGEYNASFDFNGEKLAGDFPNTATNLMKEWILDNLDEVQNSWDKINKGEKPNKIAPLQ